MVFSSLPFLLLFLPFLILLYFAGRSLNWKNAVLLVFSLAFYAWGEPKWVVCMVGAALVNYFCALGLDSASQPVRKKLILAFGAGISLGLLFYFKYFSFFGDTISRLFSLNWNIKKVRLPIGISFYTFQILTYTVDVYRGKVPPQRDFAKLMLYVSCFPQLIAGPIVQYADIAEHLSERKTTISDFSEGMGRFSIGLAKKVLLANICGEAAEILMNSPSKSILGSWMAALMYAFQIYYDFSAYSDMAIGLGRVFGFSYRENFNYPYVSGSVTEFWRRWHISLGSFFRDYVYIPLGGSRKGNLITVRNIVIVWALTGLWHGASWNFVIWGLYYCVWLLLEKFLLKKFLEKVPGILRKMVTFLIVLIGWVLFYHESLTDGWNQILVMLGVGTRLWTDEALTQVLSKYTVFPLIAATCCLPFIPWVKKRISNHPKATAVSGWIVPVLETGLFLLTIAFLAGQSFNPFIYFRF